MQLVPRMTDGPRPAWPGQLARFAVVGLAATLTHVGVALLATSHGALSPQQANLAGFTAAVGLSFLGHLRVTFRVREPRWCHLRRFVVLSVASLAVSSLITALCIRGGGDMRLAMVLVALVVPAWSFLAARLWAFATHAVTIPDPETGLSP